MSVALPLVGRDNTDQDYRSPVIRLAQFLDDNSMFSLGMHDNSGVVGVRGRINGIKVIAFCTDATKMGGALGISAASHIVHAIDVAVRERYPVIGLWHSGGAKIAEGVESLHGMGEMFAVMTRASGVVPQTSVILGPAAGAAAYGPALTDLVIMAPAGRLFVTGPDVVRSVTGEEIDMEGLGGPDTQGRRSGVAHVIAQSEADAYLQARRFVTMLGHPGRFDLHLVSDERDLRTLLPERANRCYDVRPLVREILDVDCAGPNFYELQVKWAPNVVIGLGRFAGRSVGVIANNPLRKGGCLDSCGAEKASRFVRMCDSFGVPMLVIVDVPGYLPGVGEEWNGVVRRGAKLLHAFAEAVVPRVTLITRKAYGGAYIAMNSRSLGATAVFAWPDAEVAVMGASAAVSILHRKTLAAAPKEEERGLRERLIEEHCRAAGGVARAVALGVVDDIVTPAQTRRRLATALAAAPRGRGYHTNIPL